MNKFFLIVVLLFTGKAKAYEPRDLLQKKATLQQVKTSLVSKDQWIKYPAYANCAAWDKLTGPLKKELIQEGEKYLNYEWKVIRATDYLEYERSGSRVAMENPFGSNNTALSHLLLAELAEGKGRFMDQVINGVWQACEMSSWALSAHLGAQKSRRSLPDFNEQIIDLTSGDLGAFLSWAWYFLHNEWDKTNPVISSKLRNNIEQRILQPYMARSDYWWQAFNYKPGMLVNNWNPWCNFNVLTCFLLLEDDADKLSAAVHRTMISVDKFINYTNEDGACEEGPSYWGHAAGKLYDYLQLLSYATNEQINIFNEPMIKNMGEYIARSYIGNGWVVNFADASAKGGGEPGVIYRYGKAVGSIDMQKFAAYLVNNKQGNNEVNAGRDFFRTIENISSYHELLKTALALPSATCSWYPQTQFCYMKNKAGFFFAAKGGYNNESHNHNDVGTFSLYVDETPVFIDAGVGTYTRQTFSSERYSIWTMQSNYHNLPMINGMPQQFGSQYRAKDVVFDAKKSLLTMDISGAYNKEAAVNSWVRSYTLSPTGGLVIEDVFQMTAAKAANQVNFMTWAKPDISQAGVVLIEKDNRRIKMDYDASLFEVSIETIPQTDPRLSKVWGSELYRLSLTAKKQLLRGKYKFTINKY
ncbi:heparinase II/III-family protein [Chitinophagaceae bacterium LB-8]|uniref:Heparinase II/III-family protein n=1 Tax=Paraflavisolibacter caeni TaxID=2982496 RepID=A0A9X2XQ31_9BACT|nr:heparinase II/III family protein [Paraflavisolibacter caeni]MCU7552838.1 heparinase II/III-family protein [Paraflavisolibacter caeni]